MNITSLIEQADQGTVSFEEFAQNAENNNLVEFVNSFSMQVAKKYFENSLDYETCDSAMNYLFSFMTDEIFLSCTGNYIPDPAMEIYDAFDAGEYNHSGDSKTVDPIAKYTNPFIKQILAKYDS